VEPHGRSPWHPKGAAQSAEASAHNPPSPRLRWVPAPHSSTGTARGLLRRRVKDRLSGVEGQIVGLKGELGGEIRALQSEIRRLDSKIDNLRNELKADIARLDEKLTFTNKRLDEALEIRERLATLEAKLRQ